MSSSSSAALCLLLLVVALNVGLLNCDDDVGPAVDEDDQNNTATSVAVFDDVKSQKTSTTTKPKRSTTTTAAAATSDDPKKDPSESADATHDGDESGGVSSPGHTYGEEEEEGGQYDGDEEEECEVVQGVRREAYQELGGHLVNVRHSLLDALECAKGAGARNCSQVIVHSDGYPALRHPTRFGLYSLTSVYEGYPAYERRSSGQVLFFQKEYEQWEYAHRVERWIVGPQLGVSVGGLLFLSKEKCPWKFNYRKIQVFYFDKKEPNTWNPRGNGWKEDDSVRILCNDRPLVSACGNCAAVEVAVGAEGGAARFGHSDKAGVYHLEPQGPDSDFTAPIFKKEGEGGRTDYLYSHHHEGRVWLLGNTVNNWALRLDLTGEAHGHALMGVVACPHVRPWRDAAVWQYLQSSAGRGAHKEENWKDDPSVRVRCVRRL